MSISTARHAIQHFFGEVTLSPGTVWEPYPTWEKLFVARWGLQPLPSGTLIRDYMLQRGIDPLRVNVVQALQVFHLNTFRVPQHMFSQWKKYEGDYDKVPPFIVGLGEMEDDGAGGRKLQKQWDEEHKKR